ncbi:hypothetical protein [Clostridium butyricum]|nr:hypothetical protein [Clostridium butyricum]
MNIEEVSYKFSNLQELTDKMNSINILTMSYDAKLGLIKKTYFIKLKFNKDVIDDLIKEHIKTGNEEKDSNVYNYIQDVNLTNSITVPDLMDDSNYADSIEKNTGIWSYKLSQIDENTEINLVYSVRNYTMLICIFITLLICAGVGYYIKKIKNR